MKSLAAAASSRALGLSLQEPTQLDTYSQPLRDPRLDAVARNKNMPDTPVKEERKPWIVPSIAGALEPEDIANSYQLHQDSNPHSNNDHS